MILDRRELQLRSAHSSPTARQAYIGWRNVYSKGFYYIDLVPFKRLELQRMSDIKDDPLCPVDFPQTLFRHCFPVLLQLRLVRLISMVDVEPRIDGVIYIIPIGPSLCAIAPNTSRLRRKSGDTLGPVTEPVSFSPWRGR